MCWATHGNLTVTHIPRVGILIGHQAFDLSISNCRREINHLFLLILTIIFCPRVGILIIFSNLPPSGLTCKGFIKVLCRRSVRFLSQVFSVFL